MNPIISIAKSTHKLFEPKFLKARKEQERDIWLVVGLAALLGMLYGVFITPFWSEAVDFGQAWAGLVSYERSTWGGSIFGAPSLQFILPALLLLLGFKTWTLSLLFTGLFCAVSFSAVAAASFVFCRSRFFSIFITMLFLFYQFSQVHGYPVIYPVMYWQFGQTGQYLALLGFSLLACHKPKTAGIIGGWLAGVHAVWCLCFVVGAFPVALFLQRRSFIKLVSSFMAAVVFSVGLLFWGASLMPAKPPYIAPIIPVLPAKVAEKPSVEEAQAPKKKNIYNEHNVTFLDSKNIKASLIQTYHFFFSEIAFFALCLLLFFIQKYKVLPHYPFQKEKQLLAMIALPVTLSILLQVVKEIDPEYALFAVVDGRVPGLLTRAILNRWLNLTNIIVPILTISTLLVFIREKKYWPAFLGFLLLLPLAFTHRFEQEKIVALVLFVLCLGLFSEWVYTRYSKQGQRFLGLTRAEPLVLTAILSTFYLFYLFSSLTFHAVKDPKVLGKDAIDPVVAAAKADAGVLLLGSYVVGGPLGFNPQLRTERPIIVPSALNVYNATAKKIVSVYCFSDLNGFAAFYVNVQPCFEKRSKAEWQVVGRELHTSGMIVPDSWKLKIPATISGGGFSYYRFTETSKG